MGLVLGFAAFVLRLVKMRSLVEEAASEAPETPPEELAAWDDEKREEDDW